MPQSVSRFDKVGTTAPGDLGFVHAFLNTWKREGNRERFESPERIKSWLLQRGLAAESDAISRKEFEEILALRRGLRARLSAPRESKREQSRELKGYAKRAKLGIEFNKQGEPILVAASGAPVERLISSILSIFYRSTVNRDWDRMKVCANDECQAVFFDRSKNRSGVWCSSKGCGNRLNARAYRARL